MGYELKRTRQLHQNELVETSDSYPRIVEVWGKSDSTHNLDSYSANKAGGDIDNWTNDSSHLYYSKSVFIPTPPVSECVVLTYDTLYSYQSSSSNEVLPMWQTLSEVESEGYTVSVTIDHGQGTLSAETAWEAEPWFAGVGFRFNFDNLPVSSLQFRVTYTSANSFGGDFPSYYGYASQSSSTDRPFVDVGYVELTNNTETPVILTGELTPTNNTLAVLTYDRSATLLNASFSVEVLVDDIWVGIDQACIKDPNSTNTGSTEAELSGTFNYCISPDQYSDYDITIKVSSDSHYNNHIGFMVASDSTNYLSVVRNVGYSTYLGSFQNWKLILDRNNVVTDLQSFNIGENSSPGTVDQTGQYYKGWDGRYSYIRVVRQNNKIYSWCSDWNSDQLVPESEFVLDLDLYPEFKTSSFVGYISGNQDQCVYEVINFTGKLYNKEKGINIPDGSISNVITINIPGYNSTGYESAFNETFVWMTENFSSIEYPINPVKGQLWYKTTGVGTSGNFYIYVSDDPTQYSLDTNWHSVSDKINEDLQDHIANLNNPHEVTKDQVGLSLVDNVLVFNKNLNLSDVLNVAAARTNLGVYSKNETYSSTEYNGKYLSISSKSANTELLDGLDSTAYVKSLTPEVTVAIDATSVVPYPSSTTGVSKPIIQTSQNSFIGYKTDKGLNLITGSTYDYKFVSDNIGVAEIVSRHELQTDGSGQSIRFNLIPGGTIGSLISLQSGAGSYSFKTDNLYVNEAYQVYHDGKKPTPADVGALAINGTAADSALLNGINSSSSVTNSTIVQRDASGDISAYTLSEAYTSIETSISSTANVAYRMDNSTNNYIRFANTTQFGNYLGLNCFIDSSHPRGSYCWSATQSQTFYSVNLLYSRYGVGQYRFYFTNFKPTSANYGVLVGTQGNYQAAPISNSANTGTLNQMFCYPTNKTDTYFDIYCVTYTNTATSGVVGNQTYSRNFVDTGLETVLVFFNGGVAM